MPPSFLSLEQFFSQSFLEYGWRRAEETIIALRFIIVSPYSLYTDSET